MQSPLERIFMPRLLPARRNTAAGKGLIFMNRRAFLSSLCLGFVLLFVCNMAQAEYKLTNLVSNQVGAAKHDDPLIVRCSKGRRSRNARRCSQCGTENRFHPESQASLIAVAVSERRNSSTQPFEKYAASPSILGLTTSKELGYGDTAG